MKLIAERNRTEEFLFTEECENHDNKTIHIRKTINYTFSSKGIESTISVIFTILTMNKFVLSLFQF